MNGQVAEILNLCALISEAIFFFTETDMHAHTHISWLSQPTTSLKIKLIWVGRNANQQAVEMLKSKTETLRHHRANASENMDEIAAGELLVRARGHDAGPGSVSEIHLKHLLALNLRKLQGAEHACHAKKLHFIAR